MLLYLATAESGGRPPLVCAGLSNKKRLTGGKQAGFCRTMSIGSRRIFKIGRRAWGISHLIRTASFTAAFVHLRHHHFSQSIDRTRGAHQYAFFFGPYPLSRPFPCVQPCCLQFPPRERLALTSLPSTLYHWSNVPRHLSLPIRSLKA